jgi:hypothetical protein
MTSPLVPRKNPRTGMKEYYFSVIKSHWEINLDSPILKVLLDLREIVKLESFWIVLVLILLKHLNIYVYNTSHRDSNLVDSASSIRLSQRLSHACLSINKSILWNCEWLIISVIVYLKVLATWITVVILELIHASNPDFWKGCIY